MRDDILQAFQAAKYDESRREKPTVEQREMIEKLNARRVEILELENKATKLQMKLALQRDDLYESLAQHFGFQSMADMHNSRCAAGVCPETHEVLLLKRKGRKKDT